MFNKNKDKSNNKNNNNESKKDLNDVRNGQNLSDNQNIDEKEVTISEAEVTDIHDNPKKDVSIDDIEAEIDENIDIRDQLPEGYDVISEYQDNIEQSLVDNLFDYFGRVYYKVNSDQDLNENVSKKKAKIDEDVRVRNKYTSNNDRKLFWYTKRNFTISLIISFVLLALAAVGWGLYGSLIGTSVGEVTAKAIDLASTSSFIVDSKGWIVFFVFWLTFISFISLLFLISTIFSYVFYFNWRNSTNRLRYKNKLWDKSFDNFANNLSSKGILNAIQASIPEFVLDKYTPIYDKAISNLHNRIYNYANIPDDARQIGFSCLASGFYKGSAFSLSFSKWEWFREAKVINEEQVSRAEVKLSARRSLRRFEDTMCVLVMDTYAEPKLNFVLNNPDGRNLRLQNKIFNSIFSLAVNNPRLAYSVFTPYVQHTLSRCKTWSPICRAIRQVIKEGSKVYIVFDGRDDFFKFNRITDPKQNYVFNTNLVSESFKLDRLSEKKGINPYGSLDQTASLMAEYVLEEVDLLFSALEMGSCYPFDDLLLTKNKNARTLYDVLEEKKLQEGDKFKTINELNNNFSDISSNLGKINFEREPLAFRPMVNIDIENKDKPIFDDSTNRPN